MHFHVVYSLHNLFLKAFSASGDINHSGLMCEAAGSKVKTSFPLRKAFSTIFFVSLKRKYIKCSPVSAKTATIATTSHWKHFRLKLGKLDDGFQSGILATLLPSIVFTLQYWNKVYWFVFAKWDASCLNPTEFFALRYSIVTGHRNDKWVQKYRHKS